MMRACLHCQHPFSPRELSKNVSKKIEAERKSCGLQGFHFRCYVCAACSHESLFVDMQPFQGESDADFTSRRHELETTIRNSRLGEVQVALVEKRADTDLPNMICF